MNTNLRTTLRILFAALITTAFTVGCGGAEDGLDGTDGEDGRDGTSVTVVDLDEGDENCPEGGQELIMGTELDEDGNVIADAESTSIYYICNGEDGIDGDDGQPIVTRERDATTDECPNGGTFIEFGYPDEDGELDEVVSDTLVCNGLDGVAGVAELADPPTTCADDPDMARCDADPENFQDWSPASLINSFEVANFDCCKDFNNDGRIDNSLPTMIRLFSTLGDFNQSLQDSIDSGRITFLLEYNNLESLEAGETTDLFVHRGEEAVDETGVLINPDGFEAGAYPKMLLPDGIVEEDGEGLQITAGPGRFTFEIELYDMMHELTLENAEITATPVGTSVEGGVIVERGTMAGLILFENFAEIVNNVGSSCDCLGNPDQTLYVPEGDASGAACVLDVTQAQIDSCGSNRCGQLAQFCGAIPMITNIGMPTTPGGPKDAFGAGLNFTAEATTILGVIPED